MGWSVDFVNALQKRQHSPIWRVQTSSGTYWTNSNFGSVWSASTNRKWGESLIVPGSIRFEPSGISPRYWDATIGGFSFDVISDSSLRDAPMRRGTWMSVYVDLDGNGLTDERVAIGMVQSITFRGGARWTIACNGPLDALNSRYKTGQDGVLFSPMPSTISTVGAFTTGGGYPKTLNVAVNSDFWTPTPHIGLLAIGNVASTAAWLAYDSKGANTFHITGEYYGGPTPAGSYPIGTTVRQMALYKGHPVDIFRSMFTSTGLGTNGTYDYYLAQMGLGVPSSWWDTESDLWKVLRTVAGTYDTAFQTVEPIQGQQSSLGFVLGLMKLVGFWPVMRQGNISVHGARPLDTGWSPGGPSPFKIGDADIFQIEQHDWYDPQVPNVYGGPNVIYHVDPTTGAFTQVTGGGTVTLSSLPYGGTYNLDITDVVDSSRTTDSSLVATEVLNSLRSWYSNPTQKITLLARGWIWAGMAPGDWIDVTTTRIGQPGDPSQTYDSQHCCVMEIQPFFGTYTKLTLATA